jgi:hypothetical protein
MQEFDARLGKQDESQAPVVMLYSRCTLERIKETGVACERFVQLITNGYDV